MHPLMKHGGKMRPTQPEMTTANQSVIFKHVLRFCVSYAIENSLANLKLLAQCFLFICEWGDGELPASSQWQENGCWDFQLGGKKWDVTVREAQSRESWRRDKNVSIHANWCPDPPPGCRCLLSGERIKGPFTKHKDFHFFSTQSLSPFSCCF